MRIFGLILLVLSLIVILLYISTPKEALIDSFEGPLTKETVDFGAAEGSSVKVSADTQNKVCGEQSLKIEYNLDPSGYMWVARGYNLDVKGADKWLVAPEDIPWKSYNAVSLMMHGSGQGAVVAFDIKDNLGEIWRYVLDDDTKGWKEVICLFKDFFPRKDWQPDNAERNEIIDFPIKSFQFEPRLAGKGQFSFDCIKVLKAK
ncbi:MAG: hypothetical protein JW867_00045 [Candidatus Omnitrophica bacterium]|nr:hypothetical protein [Candidatus Omnitrophota bacterium]